MGWPGPSANCSRTCPLSVNAPGGAGAVGDRGDSLQETASTAIRRIRVSRMDSMKSACRQCLRTQRVQKRPRATVVNPQANRVTEINRNLVASVAFAIEHGQPVAG